MSAVRRVAVTGLGIVSPLGHTVSNTWSNLLSGISGIKDIEQFDASGFPTRIAAEVKGFSLAPRFLTKNNRFANRFTRFALEAAQQAIDDAQFSLTDESMSHRFGVVTGSGMMTTDF